MRIPVMFALAALLCPPLIAACGDDSAPSDLDGAGDVSGVDAATDTSGSDVAVLGACDPSRPPVVMAHGFLAAGDTWAPFAQRFVANGDCPERLYAFDWNPFQRGPALDLLDAFIDAVRAETGAAQVQLMGHSAGGTLGWSYLLEPARAAKVSHYAHLGSDPAPEGEATLPTAGPADAPVPTVNVWSPGDTIVPGADIAGATNAELAGLDHYQVATDAAAFVAVYTHFRGAAPAITDRAAVPSAVAGKRRVSGKALTIGENVPVTGGTVTIWPVEPSTGQPMGADPVATFTASPDGSFGPAELDAGVPHVFVLQGANAGDRTVRYYREPFVADDAFVYLRALPSEDSLVGILFSTIPFPVDSSVIIAFSASRGVLSGRDTLTVAGEVVSTEAYASADRTAIAWFFFDDGEDLTSSGLVETFDILPTFLVALDRAFPTTDTAPITLELNGRTLVLPRLPAATDGALVAIFD